MVAQTYSKAIGTYSCQRISVSLSLSFSLSVCVCTFLHKRICTLKPTQVTEGFLLAPPVHQPAGCRHHRLCKGSKCLPHLWIYLGVKKLWLVASKSAVMNATSFCTYISYILNYSYIVTRITTCLHFLVLSAAKKHSVPAGGVYPPSARTLNLNGNPRCSSSSREQVLWCDCCN